MLVGTVIALGTLTTCGGASESETPPETVTVTTSAAETNATTKTVTSTVKPTTADPMTTEATTEPADVNIDPDTNPAANVDVDQPRRVVSVPESAPVQSQAPAPAPASTYYKNCSVAPPLSMPADPGTESTWTATAMESVASNPQIQRPRKPMMVRGFNRAHNPHEFREPENHPAHLHHQNRAGQSPRVRWPAPATRKFPSNFRLETPEQNPHP